jgi:hypothetical protein
LLGLSPFSLSVVASCVRLQLSRPLRSIGITRLRRYYEPLRHPKRPGRSLATCQLIRTAITAGTSRVAYTHDRDFRDVHASRAPNEVLARQLELYAGTLFKFVDNGQNLDHRAHQTDNFFMKHPTGHFKVQFAPGCSRHRSGTPIWPNASLHIHLLAEDGSAQKIYDVVAYPSERRLAFSEKKRPSNFLMEKGLAVRRRYSAPNPYGYGHSVSEVCPMLRVRNPYLASSRCQGERRMKDTEHYGVHLVVHAPIGWCMFGFKLFRDLNYRRLPCARTGWKYRRRCVLRPIQPHHHMDWTIGSWQPISFLQRKGLEENCR